MATSKQIKRLRENKCVSCGGRMTGSYMYYPTLCRTCAGKRLKKKK